ALDGSDMQPIDLDSPPLLEKTHSTQGSVAMTLCWRNLNVHLPIEPKAGSKLTFWRKKPYNPSKRKPVLRNVSGIAEPGQLLAILGSSGAGKTTLLNVLTKRNLGPLIVEGVVTVNGTEMSASKIRQVSAYVQQDDLFVGTLTVREHLNFHALLRMGSKFTAAQRRQRVNDVLVELGLTKCADTLVGIPNRIKGISGGERKRLAFASEILTNPGLLFCDEPTSGLDSFLAQQIIAVLKQLATKGRTIVITIHQPSSQVFAMFDRICLMAEGRLAYLGPAKTALDLWQSCGYPCPPKFNPADHYIRTLAIKTRHEKECQRRVKTICDAYEISAVGVETMKKTEHLYKGSTEEFGGGLLKWKTKKSKRYRASWFQQLWAVTWRSYLTTVREPMLLKVRLFQTLIVAVLTGLVYFQTTISSQTIININGILFQLVANMNFMFQFAVVEVFCLEMPIFMREHLSGIYRVDVYYLSKQIAELPQYILLPILFTAIVYWMAGLVADAGVFFIACRLPCPVNFSPSDHYIRCLSMKQKHDKECERKIQMICSTYRDSKNYSTLEKYLVSQERRATTSANKSINKLMVASRFTQLIYLLWRSMISALREPRLTRIRYSETLIAAIINGLVFYQLPMVAENMATYKGLIFQITTNMTYLYVFGVLEIFCTELPVFYQEYGKGLYRIETYYFSKIFSEVKFEYIIDFLDLLFVFVLFCTASRDISRFAR
uniref:ABC transporter domain-containing protein n=1 Tax=Plectus sambesii TaxID=2011161 RepID=A0A914XPT6_9BILA